MPTRALQPPWHSPIRILGLCYRIRVSHRSSPPRASARRAPPHRMSGSAPSRCVRFADSAAADADAEGVVAAGAAAAPARKGMSPTEAVTWQAERHAARAPSVSRSIEGRVLPSAHRDRPVASLNGGAGAGGGGAHAHADASRTSPPSATKPPSAWVGGTSNRARAMLGAALGGHSAQRERWLCTHEPRVFARKTCSPRRSGKE